MTSFTQKILPLFEPHDVDCMIDHGVKLNDFEYMSDAAGDEDFPDHAHARRVYAHLSGAMFPRMPPGTPWSSANQMLFRQWMDDGFTP